MPFEALSQYDSSAWRIQISQLFVSIQPKVGCESLGPAATPPVAPPKTLIAVDRASDESFRSRLTLHGKRERLFILLQVA